MSQVLLFFCVCGDISNILPSVADRRGDTEHCRTDTGEERERAGRERSSSSVFIKVGVGKVDLTLWRGSLGSSRVSSLSEVPLYLVGVLQVKGVDDVVVMTPFTYESLLRTELERMMSQVCMAQ